MHKYLITSGEFYKDSSSDFGSLLYTQIKKHTPTYILYRDKTNQNYSTQAVEFIKVCNQFQDIKSFIHQHVELAKELGAKGVHLTSKQFKEISHAKSLGLEVIISTHTHEELLKAQELGADAVTYSPIFSSPGKGEPKGIEDLEDILSKCRVNVFALGGIIEESHIEMIAQTKAYGFASIRYFE